MKKPVEIGQCTPTKILTVILWFYRKSHLSNKATQIYGTVPDVPVDFAPVLKFSSPEQPGFPICVGMTQPAWAGSCFKKIPPSFPQPSGDSRGGST
jgi:hypothetical protein